MVRGWSYLGMVALTVAAAGCGDVTVSGAATCAKHADGPLSARWSTTFRGEYVETCSGDGCNGFKGSWGIDSVAVAHEKGLLVAGHYWGTGTMFLGQALPEGPGKSAFLAKVDDAGHVEWLKSFAGDSNLFLSQIHVTQEGKFWLSALADTSTDLGGGSLPFAGGGYFVQFDAAGNYLKAIPGSGSVAITDNGDLVVVGGFEDTLTLGDQTITAGGPTGHPDAYIARLNSAGVVQAVHVFGDATPNPLPSLSDQYFFNVVIADDGNLFVAGLLTGSTDIGGSHLSSGDSGATIVASFTPSLEVRFARTIGDGNQEGSMVSHGPIVLTDTGNLLVAASLLGTIDLGNGPLKGGANGLADGLLVELSPSGDVVRSEVFPTPGGGGIASFTKSGCLIRACGYSSGALSLRGATLPADEDLSAFMLMLAPDGAVVGQKRFRGPLQCDIAERPDGSFVMGGSYSGSLTIGDFTAGPEDVEAAGFLADFASLSR